MQLGGIVARHERLDDIVVQVLGECARQQRHADQHEQEQACHGANDSTPAFSRGTSEKAYTSVYFETKAFGGAMHTPINSLKDLAMKSLLIAVSLLVVVASHSSFVAPHGSVPALACGNDNCIGPVDSDGTVTFSPRREHALLVCGNERRCAAPDSAGATTTSTGKLACDTGSCGIQPAAWACVGENCIGPVDADDSVMPIIELACQTSDCLPPVELQSNPTSAVKVACTGNDCSPATSA